MAVPKRWCASYAAHAYLTADGPKPGNNKISKQERKSYPAARPQPLFRQQIVRSQTRVALMLLLSPFPFASHTRAAHLENLAPTTRSDNERIGKHGWPRSHMRVTGSSR